MNNVAAEIRGLGFELRRRFRASPDRIFRAWTQPRALRNWWCPPGWTAGRIEVDLRVGGTYRIAMIRAGSANARIAVSGRFLEVRPPHRLVYTWHWEGAFLGMPDTVVTLELEGSSDETLLSLRHEGFSEPGARQQHRSGWMSACERLDRTVAPSLLPLKRSAAL